MLIRETWGFREGAIRAVIRRNGMIVAIIPFENLIVDAGRVHMAGVLAGIVMDGEIKYVEVGTDATPPTVADTALLAPAFRKAVTAQSLGATPGQVTTTVYLSTSEANVLIREVGWFAGSAADDTFGTGTMIARSLFAHDKTILETIQLDRLDQL